MKKFKKIILIITIIIISGTGLYEFGWYSHKPKTEKFVVEVAYKLKQSDVEEIIADRNPKVDPQLRPIIAWNILNESNLAGIDPAIIISQVDIESNFNPFCIGKKGEIGLMQLLPDAQADAIKAMGLERNEVFWIKNNLHLGVKYTKEQMKRFGGDVAMALSGYNAGPNATIKAKRCPNPTTEDYVRYVLASYAQIKNTYKGE